MWLSCISIRINNNIIINNFYRYYINLDFEYKNHILAMSNLAKPYSSKYMFKVLLSTLRNFNIKYNIKR